MPYASFYVHDFWKMSLPWLEFKIKVLCFSVQHESVTMEVNFMCRSLFVTIQTFRRSVHTLVIFSLCKTFRIEVLWQIGTWSNRAYSGTWLNHKFKAVSEALIVHSEHHSLKAGSAHSDMIVRAVKRSNI